MLVSKEFFLNLNIFLNGFLKCILSMIKGVYFRVSQFLQIKCNYFLLCYLGSYTLPKVQCFIITVVVKCFFSITSINCVVYVPSAWAVGPLLPLDTVGSQTDNEMESFNILKQEDHSVNTFQIFIPFLIQKYLFV